MRTVVFPLSRQRERRARTEHVDLNIRVLKELYNEGTI
jgi:hypothetical protein